MKGILMSREVEQAIKYWDKVHAVNAGKEIKIDDWLEDFDDIIEKCTTPVLDLGCGTGNDTLYLTRKNKKVIACDRSVNAIEAIKTNIPDVYETNCFDMLEGLPYADESFELVIADLCLHYFREKDTIKIIDEIRRVLKDGGHLIFRVNSIHDVNHGAGKGIEIEPHLFETSDGRLKRFFDDEDAKSFFKDFHISSFLLLFNVQYTILIIINIPHFC